MPDACNLGMGASDAERRAQCTTCSHATDSSRSIVCMHRSLTKSCIHYTPFSRRLQQRARPAASSRARQVASTASSPPLLTSKAPLAAAPAVAPRKHNCLCGMPSGLHAAVRASRGRSRCLVGRQGLSALAPPHSQDFRGVGPLQAGDCEPQLEHRAMHSAPAGQGHLRRCRCRGRARARASAAPRPRAQPRASAGARWRGPRAPRSLWRRPPDCAPCAHGHGVCGPTVHVQYSLILLMHSLARSLLSRTLSNSGHAQLHEHVARRRHVQQPVPASALLAGQQLVLA